MATSFFGWNGNECSGLVLLDDRVTPPPSRPAAGTSNTWSRTRPATSGSGTSWAPTATPRHSWTRGSSTASPPCRLDAKYGATPPLIVWPTALSWLPTIGREDLRLRLLRLAGPRQRRPDHPGPRGRWANLGTLFSLAYDRGGKIIEMIRNRLGPERFFEFWRGIYREYAFEDVPLRRLPPRADPSSTPPATGRRSSTAGSSSTPRPTGRSVASRPWAPPPPGACAQSLSSFASDGAMVEPTVLMCRSGEKEVRVPIWPDRGSYDTPGAHVEKRDDKTWTVSLTAPGRVSQVIVDPDHALLDAKPDNNRWKPEVAWRLTPMMTPLDESSQFQAFDRPSIVAGPFIDAVRPRRFQGRRFQRLEKLADFRLGRHRARAQRGHLRRPGHAPALPLATLLVGVLLRGRALQLLQRQAPLRWPGLPPLHLPAHFQLPGRRRRFR